MYKNQITTIQMGKIELKSQIINDEYTEYIYDSFDIQNKVETSVTIDFDLSEAKKFNWNIGVIYGSSGCGKTSILRRMGDLSHSNFDANKPLISNFNWLTPKEATFLLTSMGLSSVPTWLRPFHLLSNGEQYRAEVAYKVSKAQDGDVILIDEYTSVVDRDVAKAMSYTLQKYIRKTKKRLILASCHYDIMEWLMPDWTYSPQKGGALERCDYLRRGKPQIELQVSRVESDTWNLFKAHHYLTQNINKSCKSLLFEWNGKPVGFLGMINQPNKGKSTAMAISRVVVLPDYQGLGLGVKIAEFSAAIFKANGACNIYIKTVNPALGEYMEKSNLWEATGYNGKFRTDPGSNERAKNRLSRRSYNFQYIGESISGYEDLLKPIKEMRWKN